MRFSLGEIMRGIPLKQKSDPKTVAHLTEWLCELRHDYGDRILPIADQIASNGPHRDNPRYRRRDRDKSLRIRFPDRE
ncbi:hypothetical protein ASD52_14250 [Ensifer sp. Root142]|nr:hypothetical protein ASD52_14250 [Ensifer sp. Root142]